MIIEIVKNTLVKTYKDLQIVIFFHLMYWISNDYKKVFISELDKKIAIWFSIAIFILNLLTTTINQIILKKEQEKNNNDKKDIEDGFVKYN